MGVITEWLRLLRPHQWSKNGFVLLGLMFSRQWQPPAILAAISAFLAFCAISSSVYVFNDIQDIEADRQHPTKRIRPLASGAISIRGGWIISGGLAALALLLAAMTGRGVAVFVLIYAALNVSYSLRLKHIAVLDVFIISTGFILRILAGTMGLGIAPSSWLFLCGFMLSLFLGFGKRRAELLSIEYDGSPETRASARLVLKDYSPLIVDQFMAISAACTIISYALYTVNAETIARYGTKALIYTLPFVVYGLFRYIFLVHRLGKGSDTALDLYSDAHLLLTVLAWGVVTLVVLS
ncbi:decaprenyl-phosphate phosphoribosyltransferase [Acididesulfobacillus acetoxydans]|uniref:decaprenyl-phosphate phosphoribosyltransferase n=1 Tax=Acididesulfobacillus acetoxydans TaxID=1561005 RepID=UPI0021C18C65|nr:decaprenyl-phosphate phosphoribosyltransferase [Acididesulfobacillus acetoxydans]